MRLTTSTKTNMKSTNPSGPRPTTPFRSEPPRDDAERELPHNRDAERAVLGAIVLDDSALKAATEKLDETDFFDRTHILIFRAMSRLIERGSSVDLVTLVEELTRSGDLESAGGAAYVSQLADGLPRVSNTGEYAQIVADRAIARRLIYFANDLADSGFSTRSTDEILADVDAKFAKFRERSRPGRVSSLGFTWDECETETELKAGGTGTLPYLVDGLLPLDDITMYAGREGSCKTLLATYTGRCVANGVPVFGCLPTIRKPVLYLDAENHPGTHQVYLPFFEGIGDEEIRFRTLRSGVPALTDASLLRICEEKRPLLILDSLIRFCGTRDRDASEMTQVMEQLSRLVTAGATILLIHHTRRSDEEEYANSFAIGATVAFWYAITTEDSGLGIKRVHMVHKKARGGSETHRHLIAFPSILDRGTFVLDGDLPKTDVDLLVEFVTARGSCNFSAIREHLRGMGMARKNAAVKQAVEAGLLSKSRHGREDVYATSAKSSESRNFSFENFDGSDAGTSENL